MFIEVEGSRVAPVMFTGKRGTLFGRLLRGYLLMVPTLGLYRFWLTTAKRRFYWQNTVIDGDPLEYTGSALQLFIGFLFAVAFFLPMYIAFFYFSTQPGIALFGYAAVGVIIWFMMGYAIYRARDFRLSRTLWRGIRFDQRGSAWGYAVRRFLWSILVVLTLGLAYPFMASHLWRYRYAHTWYGDRQFRWEGDWKTLGKPFYISYVITIIPAILLLAPYVSNRGSAIALVPILALVILFFGVSTYFFYYRAREATRMFSKVRLGDAALTVHVRARSLLAQFGLYCLTVIGALFVIGVVGLPAAFLVFQGSTGAAPTIAGMSSAGLLPLVVMVAAYLLGFGTLGLMGEIFLGYGFWRAVASGATISGPDTLLDVSATAEDPSLAGEGIADALNVGAY